MANNYIGKGDVINVTGPTGGLVSGQLHCVGKIPCVALVDIAEAAVGSAARRGIFELSVGGVDQSGNSAVAEGDQLYFTGADTPPINKKNTGVPFGKALGTVASAGTGTIEVVLDE